jgi:hypothetical protein
MLELKFNFDLKALYKYLKNNRWTRAIEYEKLWPVKHRRFYKKEKCTIAICTNKKDRDFTDNIIELLHFLEKKQDKFYLTILYEILCFSNTKESEEIKKKILKFILPNETKI